MDRVLLALVTAVVGAVVVGPFISHAVLAWIGWQGVVPLLLSWLPERNQLRRARAECRACGHPLTPWPNPLAGWRRSADGAAGLPSSDGGPRPVASAVHPRAGAGAPGSIGVGAGDCDEALPAGETGAVAEADVDGGAAAAEGRGLGRRLPALPWLAVRGRCRRCGERVDRWVLAIEIVTGLGFGVAAARLGWSALLPAVLVLTTGMVAMSAVDLVCSRIPVRFVYLTGLGVAAAIVGGALAEGEPSSVVGALVGGATYLVLLGLLYVLGGGGLGFGDVRLGALIGLVVGWVGWEPASRIGAPVGSALLGLITASVGASIVGVVLLVRRRRSQLYPFGPWLSLGGYLAILAVAGSWPQ